LLHAGEDNEFVRCGSGLACGGELVEKEILALWGDEARAFCPKALYYWMLVKAWSEEVEG
jgi:hypothetical protein